MAAGSDAAPAPARPNTDDDRWMCRALDLAEKGRRTVSPNPLVGCVLVRDGAVVGEGFHERAGGPHAEAAALAAAGDRAAGSTAYVSLEPCNHWGRTGPCSQALRDAGVARVVCAAPDPHRTAAGGAAALRAAGVPVKLGVREGDARRQNEVFFHGVATGRPFVVCKSAVSLDGRVAAADGTARWLTGEQARSSAHAVRAEVDAVVVGSGTVVADDPALTCRLPRYTGPQPLRVVLDGRARTTPDRALCDRAAPTLLLVGPGAAAPRVAALRAAGVDVTVLPAAAATGGVDLDAALAVLWDRGVRSALVEGGPRVTTAFLTAGRCDKLLVHLAPLLLGDAARPALSAPGAATLALAPRFSLDHVERAGDDTLLTLYPRPGMATDGGRWSSPGGEHTGAARRAEAV